MYIGSWTSRKDSDLTFDKDAIRENTGMEENEGMPLILNEETL